MAAVGASKTPREIIKSGFSGIGSDLVWYCDPSKWPKTDDAREGQGGSWSVNDKGELVVAPPAKKDFWRRTYYRPMLIKDDGPCLFHILPLGAVATIGTSFTLDPKKQFDQAGLCVRLDSEHWIKTGIEVVDGAPRLSVVVTNGYSDWSTQPWPEPRLKVRIHTFGNGSYVIEGAPLSESGNAAGSTDAPWSFIRICQLSRGSGVGDDALAQYPNVSSAFAGDSAPEGSAWVGVFSCCPEDQEGCTATFHSFTVSEGSDFDHNADGNQ